MHPTAMLNGKLFFDAYSNRLESGIVVDVGAQDVNGSLKSVCPAALKYVGVDFVAGNGVDVVLTDPYQLPFDDESVDVVVSSSCFEHSEMFWVLFLEILRVLKSPGLFYLNAPSNGGAFHRYPVDCWRFYPDSGNALTTWGRRNGYSLALLESYVCNQLGGIFNDFVAVFLKGEHHADKFPARITSDFKQFSNGSVLGSSAILNERPLSEDLERIMQFAAPSQPTN
jgi:SAM-dependent methyltransferase